VIPPPPWDWGNSLLTGLACSQPLLSEGAAHPAMHMGTWSCCGAMQAAKVVWILTAIDVCPSLQELLC